MNHSIVVIIILFLTRILYAQDFSFTSFDTDDGLLSNHISSIYEDHNHYIWLAHDNGFSRFDGHEFEHYSTKTPQLNNFQGEFFRNIFPDHNDRLWITSKDGGLFLFDTREKRIIKHFSNDPNRPGSLPNNNINTIFRDNDDILWVGCNGLGLAKLNPQDSTFTLVPTFSDEKALSQNDRFQMYYTGVYPLSEHEYLLSTLYGAYIFNPQTETTTLLPHLPDHLNIRNIHVYKDYLYLPTWSKGTYVYNTSNQTYKHLACSVAPDDNPYVTCLNNSAAIPIGDSLILTTSSYQGIQLWNTNQNTTITFTTNEDLGSIHSAIIDSRNILWIGTLGDGLFRFDLNNLFRKQYLTNSPVSASIVHNNRIYSVENEFLYITKDRKTSTYSYKESEAFRDVSVDNQGRVWILGYEHLYYFDERKQRIIKESSPVWRKNRTNSGYFWQMDIAEDVIYIGPQSGGFTAYHPYDQQYNNYTLRKGDSTSLLHPYSIGHIYAESSGNIWGSSKGVFKYSPNTESFVNLPEPILNNQNEYSSLSNAKISESPTGKIFVGNYLDNCGLLDIDNQKLNLIDANKLYGKSFIYCAVWENDDVIWIGTYDGIVRYNFQDSTSSWFGENHGISQVYDLDIYQDQLLVSSYNGLYLFSPEINKPLTAPIPYLNELQVLYEPFLNEHELNQVQEVKLKPDQNFLSILYGSQDYLRNEHKRFAYKLEGLDPDWIISEEAGIARYAQLRGGKYTFRIKESLENGSWSTEERQLKILIRKKITEMWWFWLLVASSIGLLGYAWYKRRIRKVLKEEALKRDFEKQIAEVEMKALRSQMNPHFLFNSLNAIKYYVIKREPEKAADYLTNFSKLIRQILNNSSQKLISLKEEIDTLELYIQIENMRFDHPFDYKIGVDKNIVQEDILIPPLLLQPYVENAIWHGLMHKKDGKGKLDIEIVNQENGVDINITDNGIGREKAAQVKSKSAQKNKSLGMSLTKNRMNISSITSDLEFSEKVIDLYDAHGMASGTRVIIFIKRQNS